MTEEQLAEIEQRWNSNEVTLQTINDFNLLIAEVRKLQEKLHYEETCHAEAQEEVRRLQAENAEQKKVIDATILYMKHINSPLCIGWDNLLDAMQGYRKYLESEGADK